jgi:methylglyoxal synthase
MLCFLKVNKHYLKYVLLGTGTTGTMMTSENRQCLSLDIYSLIC